MKALTKRLYFIFGTLIALLLTGLVASSFVDLKLSQAIADTDNMFGMICASFGELFGWGMTGVFGAMAFRLAQQSEKKIFKAIFPTSLANTRKLHQTNIACSISIINSPILAIYRQIVGLNR